MLNKNNLKHILLIPPYLLFILEFGRKPVTPLMMDFIANAMNDRDLNDIINKTLPPNIAQDEKTIYDKSYTVLRALITKQIVTNCSEMKELLEKTNEILAKMFKDEFDVPRRGLIIFFILYKNYFYMVLLKYMIYVLLDCPSSLNCF